MASDNVERLRFYAIRMEDEGHLNAARYMRNAADELEAARAALAKATGDKFESDLSAIKEAMR